MKKDAPRQLDASTVAVIHRVAGRWRVLTADLSGPEGSKPKILAAEEFSGGEADRLRGKLDDRRVGEVICVLPASHVVCRAASLPNGSPDQLLSALTLQAEVHLAELALSHRYGQAVLPASPGESSRTGLMLAWPESAQFDLPDFERPTHYTPDIAALAALLNGHRPEDPLLWLDRKDGAVALALTHSNGAAFRCLREESEDDEEWQQAILSAVAETALNVGHSPSFVEGLIQRLRTMLAAVPADGSLLVIPNESKQYAREMLQGEGGDEGWWSRYGIAAGALLARRGPLAPLTMMQHTPPTEKPSFGTGVISTLSQPRTAWTAGVTALLVLGLGPLLFHGVRLKVLEARFADLDSRVEEVSLAEQRAEYYGVLGKESWSMTKLLADIASSTPENIELDVVRIADGGFRVAGVASPLPAQNLDAAQLITKMGTQLQQTGIFEKVQQTMQPANAYGTREFDMNGAIVKPHHSFRYPVEQDFARWTYQDRVDDKPKPEAPSARAIAAAKASAENGGNAGEANAGGGATRLADAGSNDDARNASASRTTTSTTSSIESRDSGGSTRDSSSRSRSRNVDAPAGVGSIADRGANSGSSAAIMPELLTAEQIKSLSRQETLERAQRVAEAQKLISDEEKKKQLREQVDLLMDHLTYLRSQEGG